ncbi:MAG: cytochrome c family protein [Gemmataceae bacterium]|nr:cytochrome c family protein [Gemmataceae bacterium]
MPQVFHRSFNTLSRVSVFGSLLFLGLAAWAASVYVRSSYATNRDIARDQPIPFSHEHHVTGLGIDCRYCHDSAEKSRYAGMPATKTCMNCHQQIWTGSPVLAPLRASYQNDVPIPWVRVHRLADFAYFDHSAHVNKGVGCVTCHGPVDRMPLTWQHGTLLMSWCLDCHRQPQMFLRPREQVFNMEWQPPPDQEQQGRQLVEEYGVRQLIHCSTCHR